MWVNDIDMRDRIIVGSIPAEATHTEMYAQMTVVTLDKKGFSKWFYSPRHMYLESEANITILSLYSNILDLRSKDYINGQYSHKYVLLFRN
jgi:hypothetical protein